MTKTLRLICATLLGVAGGVTAQASTVTLITDVAVVDVASGTVAEGQSILIRDDVIAAVGAELEPQADAIVRFEGNGPYLIPSLWDSHVHIFSSPTEPDTALPLVLTSP